MSKDYETGMKVVFEPRSRTVIVNFRGRMTVLPEQFDSEHDAVGAGETYCRNRGWRAAPQRPTPSVMLRSAW